MDEHRGFNKAYLRFSKPLYTFIAKHLSKDRGVVEEIVEETFVAAWKGYSAFKHKSSYFTWLCRIALNKIADYYHDQVNSNSKIVVPLLDSLNLVDSKSLTPEEHIALNELRESVNNCLNLLPYEKRKLLWFRFWMDYSYEKISKIMGISERAVEGRLYRAKEEFAKVWQEIS